MNRIRSFLFLLLGACASQPADPPPSDHPIHSCDGVAVDIEWSALKPVPIDAAGVEASVDAMDASIDAMDASVDARSVEPVRALIDYLNQKVGEANDCTAAPFGQTVVCAPVGSTMCSATPADGQSLLAGVNEALATDGGGMLPVQIDFVSLDTCPCRNYY